MRARVHTGLRRGQGVDDRPAPARTVQAGSDVRELPRPSWTDLTRW